MAGQALAQNDLPSLIHSHRVKHALGDVNPKTLSSCCIGLASCNYMGALRLNSLWLIEAGSHRGWVHGMTTMIPADIEALLKMAKVKYQWTGSERLDKLISSFLLSSLLRGKVHLTLLSAHCSRRKSGESEDEALTINLGGSVGLVNGAKRVMATEMLQGLQQYAGSPILDRGSLATSERSAKGVMVYEL